MKLPAAPLHKRGTSRLGRRCEGDFWVFMHRSLTSEHLAEQFGGHLVQLLHNTRIQTGHQKVLRSADLQRVDPGVDALACHCSGWPFGRCSSSENNAAATTTTTTALKRVVMKWHDKDLEDQTET